MALHLKSTGIDFTDFGDEAGMTSELLDDYEEGTWTPNQGSDLTIVGSFTSAGKYTKTGNIIYTSAWVLGSTSSAMSVGSGTVCTNLPVTIGDNAEFRYSFQPGAGTGGGGYSWATSHYSYGLSPNVSAQASKIYFQLTYKYQ